MLRPALSLRSAWQPKISRFQEMILQPDMRPSRLISTLEWLLLAALLAVFVVRGFLPAWRTMNTDFPNYFLAAAIHRQGIPLDRAYEWRWFQRHKDHLQIDQSLVGFAPHPPLCAVPMLPLTWLPSLEAKRVWLVLNLGFLALALWILRRATQLPWRHLLVLAFLCILPLRENFLFGQYYVLILLLLCAAYYAFCRGRHFTSGTLLAAAASLKIFPVFFLILFLRKRNWRAVAGLVSGGLALAAVSVSIFGWNVHRIYLFEVLPRALHGDLVGPYVLQWNSFTALCHRFFLAEPEMNPAPWMSSPGAYAWVQALIATVLLFSFLLSTGEEETPRTTAWEWAAFLPLLILLSSMPTAYHHCVLILSVVVAVDFLLKDGQWRSALAVAVLYAVACYPLPGFAWLNLQGRLLGVFLLYLLLLFKAPARAGGRARTFGFALAAVFFVLLAFSNLRALRGRGEDFSRRLPPVTAGYGTFSVARSGDRLVLGEMVPDAFAAVILPDGSTQRMPVSGDVLSLAASPQSPFIYFEVTNQRSQIFRLPAAQLGQPDAVPELIGEGHDPAVSPDGRWLAYLRDEGDRATVWSSKDSEPAMPVPGLHDLAGVLEMSVSSEGNLIVAAGGAANPHLFLWQTVSHKLQALGEIPGAVRYPAISADRGMLAFSRREGGAWHLFVRDLAAGAEQRLTSSACNATAPAWEDARTLLYVTDCGRGLGLGAPARVTVR